MGSPVAQADLDSAGDTYHILPARCRVPVNEPTCFVLGEADLGGFDCFGQFGMSRQTGFFDVGLAVVACVHSVDAHVYPPLDDNCLCQGYYGSNDWFVSRNQSCVAFARGVFNQASIARHEAVR